MRVSTSAAVEPRPEPAGVDGALGALTPGGLVQPSVLWDTMSPRTRIEAEMSGVGSGVG